MTGGLGGSCDSMKAWWGPEPAVVCGSRGEAARRARLRGGRSGLQTVSGGTAILRGGTCPIGGAVGLHSGVFWWTSVSVSLQEQPGGQFRVISTFVVLEAKTWMGPCRKRVRSEWPQQWGSSGAAVGEGKGGRRPEEPGGEQAGVPQPRGPSGPGRTCCRGDKASVSLGLRSNQSKCRVGPDCRPGDKWVLGLRVQGSPEGMVGRLAGAVCGWGR